MVQDDDDSQTIMRQRPKEYFHKFYYCHFAGCSLVSDKTRLKRPLEILWSAGGGHGNDWAVRERKVLDDWIV